jgi:hypothetical protein
LFHYVVQSKEDNLNNTLENMMEHRHNETEAE